MSVLTGHSSPVRWGYISKMLAIYMLHIGSIDPTCWAYISNELIVSDWYLAK